MEIRLKIENNMSKAEERAILEKLRDAFAQNDDNYLAPLFTREFTNWACQRIQDDILVNPMEYITAYSEKEWEKEIKDLKEKLEEAQQGVIEMNEVAHNATESANYLQEEKYKFEDLIFAKNIKIDELENCIVNLKAKLYDLCVI